MREAGYLPFASGRYDVGPGLIAFGQEAGLGVPDGRLFQFDDTFAEYRAAKLAARGRGIERYFVRHELEAEVEAAVGAFIAARLAREWPDRFTKLEGADGGVVLRSHATGEELPFDAGGRYEGRAYLSTLDALAFQVQEDLAIWRREGSKEWLAAAHLCFPNHWSPGEKVGKNFAQVHGPVAEFARVNRSPGKLVDTFIERGPFVRFAWGLATDRRLDHHPTPGNFPGGDLRSDHEQDWTGRRFDPDKPVLFIRTERQTLWPFAAQGAALFTIRTYFRDVKELSRQELDLLAAALGSMSRESRIYKGLDESYEAIAGWIGGL